MKYSLIETVIEYNPVDLESWKHGDKEKWLQGRIVPNDVNNQPNYHFGEFFVLNYFEKAHWQGYVYYALGNFELNNEKYFLGRKKIAELFPQEQLEIFRTIRSQSKNIEGKGEPDLFLYMEGGPKLFLEVKKDGDRMSYSQLECLAQIRGILEADIGIVHLVRFGRQYQPKMYELDLVTFQTRRIME
jgi:hypothetical protein